MSCLIGTIINILIWLVFIGYLLRIFILDANPFKVRKFEEVTDLQKEHLKIILEKHQQFSLIKGKLINNYNKKQLK